jgi:transcriptional regulator with XRE-family HTH domain
MTKIERVRKLCKWLVFYGFAENDKELADKLGYTKSSFSQIMNEKVPLSDKFIDRLCDTNKNINKVWIDEFKGTMLLSDAKDINPPDVGKFEDLAEARKETIALLRDKIITLEKEVLELREKINIEASINASVQRGAVESLNEPKLGEGIGK